MNATPAAVRHYDFTLLLAGVEELTPAVEDALFEAGCDDATLSVRHGVVSAEFTRAGASREEAIRSAVGDVQAAGFVAEVRPTDAAS